MSNHSYLARAQTGEKNATVWNALRYLDSASDYREFLPSAGRMICFPSTEFTVLDDGRFPWGKLWASIVISIFLCASLATWLRILR